MTVLAQAYLTWLQNNVAAFVAKVKQPSPLARGTGYRIDISHFHIFRTTDSIVFFFSFFFVCILTSS
jgi:hypothetical protein